MKSILNGLAKIGVREKMRCILIILDGIGDRGQPAFKGETPLQAASTPNLDRLADLGMCGLYHSRLQGIPMPSEIAHFLMFGYDFDEFPGRGFIEALGFGIPMQDGDAALLARIFCVSPRENLLLLIHEDPDIDKETCQALHDEIGYFKDEAIEMEFYPTRGIQGILRMRGEVSARITDSNPIREGRPLMEVCPYRENCHDASALKTAKALNNYLLWCHKRLSAHPINKERASKGLLPINALGTQRPGIKGPIIPFNEKWGLKGLSIASGPVFWGLAESIGMDVIREKDTRDPETDLRLRLAHAQKALDYDFIHVHTKMPDVASHTKNPDYKKQIIEQLDGALSFAMDHFVSDPETLLVITADHSTPSSGPLIHSGETVPILMAGKNTRRDAVKAFNEISCATGALGLVKGKELMYLVLNLMDRAKLKGLMDSPVDQPYTPGHYRPLKIKMASF
jgi:2,3-bisphosphoglycerate-independent phosphoglycerate mutase